MTLTDVTDLLKVRVEQFSGIELLEFPALIAQTALWLTDHQMNLEASERFGQHYSRIPLTEGPHIVCGDALEVDWATVRPASSTHFILGNPPFLGSRTMSATQKQQVRNVSGGLKEAGYLDFVVAWYLLADRFTALNPRIRVAFVSTSSITQGEQPGIYWPTLFRNGQQILFAHRSFIWTNEARGVAQVHCIIIGFSRDAGTGGSRELYSYSNGVGEPILQLVESISPYLISGGEYVVSNRQRQISGARPMAFGNMPADGGHLLMTPEERESLVAREPGAAEWIRPYMGSREFINGVPRYCLWLEGISARELRALPAVYERVATVRRIREKSARPQLANTPHLFAQITQRPDRPFLLIPGVSSERRAYVPMGFFTQGVVASNACLVIQDATVADFGILTSRMHMDWLRVVGGRLKSDLRYSKDVVYNNFVFPTMTAAQAARLEVLAQAVLDERDANPGNTLADLYDPNVMPFGLAAAHADLDAFVDRLYAPAGFEDSSARVAKLLLLAEMT